MVLERACCSGMLGLTKNIRLYLGTDMFKASLVWDGIFGRVLTVQCAFNTANN